MHFATLIWPLSWSSPAEQSLKLVNLNLKIEVKIEKKSEKSLFKRLANTISFRFRSRFRRASLWERRLNNHHQKNQKQFANKFWIFVSDHRLRIIVLPVRICRIWILRNRQTTERYECVSKPYRWLCVSGCMPATVRCWASLRAYNVTLMMIHRDSQSDTLSARLAAMPYRSAKRLSLSLSLALN